MLRLAIIVQNSAGAFAITSVGAILLALVAVLVVCAWIVVLTGRARRAAQDFDDSASDPALEAIRRRRLVVRRNPHGREDVVVAQFEPAGKSEPTPGRG